MPALLAWELDPFDPMERALHAAALASGLAAPTGAHLVHEYPLSTEWPAMTHVWQLPGEAERRVAVNGAPEAVARLCRLPDAAARRVAW